MKGVNNLVILMMTVYYMDESFGVIFMGATIPVLIFFWGICECGIGIGKEDSLLIVVDANYIYIYSNYRRNKIINKIALEKINKVNIKIGFSYVRRSSDLFAEIFYKNGNAERKYSFEIFDKEEVKTALKEYGRNLVIEDKTTRYVGNANLKD